MITARSVDVNLPPGIYQISTILRSLGKCKTLTPKKRNEYMRKYRAKAYHRPYKRTRPSQMTRYELEAERYLLDAAIEDPDELKELWNR